MHAIQFAVTRLRQSVTARVNATGLRTALRWCDLSAERSSLAGRGRLMPEFISHCCLMKQGLEETRQLVFRFLCRRQNRLEHRIGIEYRLE